MAETEERHHFSFQEVVEALIRKEGLREGLWSLYFEFGIGAANFNAEEGSKNLVPAAIVPVKRIGLVRGSEENSLTVDAAKLAQLRNSPSKATVKRSK